MLCVRVVGFAQTAFVSQKPLQPEIGDLVAIMFEGTVPEGIQPILVFSYSNFFELPTNNPMIKVNDKYEFSFKVPRYAKYGSYYIKVGDKQFKPDQGHYELVFYKNSKPVFDTYLYKSYSLTAQFGRGAAEKEMIKMLTEKYYKQELELYPENYAAKLRYLMFQIDGDLENEDRYREEATKIIAAKLNENPTAMANVNQVTMGNLIINEGFRNDSLKQHLLLNYPGSEVAYEYLYEAAYKTEDEEEKIKKMKALLGYRTKGESSTYSGIHEHLFNYYSKNKDEKNALKSAKIVSKVNNPWQPMETLNIAITLSENNIALKSALKYAQSALKKVDDYPFGVIRYFPEYGYIPGYVENKSALVQNKKGEIFSLIGSIYARLGNTEKAKLSFKQALELSKSVNTYKNLAFFNENIGLPEEAFKAYYRVLLQAPTDSVYLSMLKKSYIDYTGSETGFNLQLEKLRQEWETLNLDKQLAKRINLPAPLFEEVYDMEGKLVDPNMVKGKTIVVDFWATWCLPCIEGFTYMQKVYNRFKDQKDVVFMIINSGSKNSLKDAQEWVKNNNFTFPFYYNDRKLADAFNLTTLPTTFVIDEKGMIQYKTVGFEGPLMEPFLGLQIKSLLK